MNGTEGSTGMGAECAAHPGTIASGSCSRCGAYVCEACTEYGERDTCPTCAELVGPAFPLSRENWDFGRLMSHAWESFSGEWLNLSLAQLIFFGITIGLSFLLQLVQTGVTMASDGSQVVVFSMLFVVQVVQTVVQGVLQLGIYIVTFDAITGRPVDLARMFSQISKAGKLILQWLAAFVALMVPLGIYAGVVAVIAGGVVGFEHIPAVFEGTDTISDESAMTALAVIGVASLIALVPLIWYGLGFYFMQFELAFDDAVGPVEAIIRSFKIAQGVRLPLFGIGIIAGLIMIAGVLACCIGLLPAAGLAQCILAGLYFTFRDTSAWRDAPHA